MKKVLILVITLAILASLGVAVTAEEPEGPPVIPSDKEFSAMVAMERAQVETSEGLPEQARIENDCADKRMEALEDAQKQIGDDEFGQVVLAELIKHLEEGEGNLGLIIADMAQDKDNPENAQIAKDVAKGIKERGWRLNKIFSDYNMPEGAQEGAERALANMEAAAEKAAWARGEREDGPPPWASERKENGTNSEGVTTKGEEAPKVPLPDEASEVTPIDEAPPVEAPSEEAPDGENAPENGPPEGVPGAPTERPDAAGENPDS